MARQKKAQRTWMGRAALASCLLLVFSNLLVAPELAGDDRELLRDNAADPYLFILLDSSMSMSLALDGSWVEANGSDPRSRMYQAKEVLYDLLKGLDGIRYGFAAFNQDQLRIQSKHWLYYVEDPALEPANSTPLSNLQSALGYPAAEPANQIEVPILDAGGSPTGDVDIVIDGDLMNFGKTFDTPAEAATCTNPLDLSNADDHQRINRYSRLGTDSDTDTVIWVEADIPGPDPTYRLTFSNADNTVLLGAATIDVTIRAEQVDRCDDGTGNPSFISSVTETLSFHKWREFLMTDDDGGSVTFVQSGGGAGNKSAVEETGGFWDFRDAQGLFSCGDDKPFSGGGWEGNYDTGRPFTTNPTFENTVIPAGKQDLVDRHCYSNQTSSCDTLLFPTSYDATINRRELDRGDMLPFHWSFRNKDEFLARLNPNHIVSPGNPEFGAAFYFEDVPDPTSGRLLLKSQYRGALAGDPPRFSPIVPSGISPVSDAVLDFRCWYVGEPNANKCGRGSLHTIYTEGFQKLLQANDPASYRCRQPYLIIISDMAGNCPGSSPVSQVAGMNTETRDGNVRSTGVSTWVLNVGTGNVTGLTNSGKGEEIKVDTKDVLRASLIDILGIIQESTRSFSSAAVPSVQADVDQKIYITQFTPRQSAAVWEGHVHAFLKPLPTAPVDPNNPASGFAPDTSHVNHLWDAAEVLRDNQAPDASTLSFPYDRGELLIGNFPNRRRLFYAMKDTDPTTDSDGDGIFDNDLDVKVPRTKYLFGPAEGSAPAGMDLNHVRKDLWSGMGVVPESFAFTSVADGSDLLTLHGSETSDAHRVFAETYAIKEVQPRDNQGNPMGQPVRYVLGDIFHATPLLVGNPTNAIYLARSEPGDDFEGYLEYFQVQQRRRKVLFVASDDSQLHAFDAGRFQGSIEDGEFDNGTGLEIFAYTPRDLLPTLRDLANPPDDHLWGVDGTPVAGDVKIDSRHRGRGSSDPPDADEREWRTIVVGGERRGGRSFFALDVSKPDPMEEEQQTFLGVDISLGFKPTDPTKALPICGRLSSADPSNVSGTANPEDCDPTGYNYPEILWEFTDPDMGRSWSTPDIGAIKVIENGNEVVKYVAIVGGGVDPDFPALGQKIYIVDVETGKMLYKRNVTGAIAAPPATIDSDQNGILDLMYITTVAGLVYRIDLDVPKPLLLGGSCPATPPVNSTDTCCASPDGPTNGCVNDPAWEPKLIFDTVTTETVTDSNGASSTVNVRKPIYFTPSVIFVSRLNSYALAFGTGNRENLWTPAPPGGNRFYLFVDDSPSLTPAQLPRVESDFTDVTDPVGVGQDLLLDPNDGNRGWFIRLGVLPASDTSFDVSNEKMLTATTAVAGVTVFSTFVPETEATETGTGQNREIRCARRGISRVYTQFATNGVEIPTPDPNNPTAPLQICETPPCTRTPDEVSTLVSEPFVEEAAAPCPGTEGMDELLMEQLFPPNCKFGPYRWNLSAMRADTGVECFAQIPVCIVEKNWKDF